MTLALVLALIYDNLTRRVKTLQLKHLALIHGHLSSGYEKTQN